MGALKAQCGPGHFYWPMVTGPKKGRMVMGFEMAVVSVVELAPTMQRVPPEETALMPESRVQ